jgi:hypothetical protein
MSQFSVFKDINNVEQPHDRNMAWVIDRIRSGGNRSLIERIRTLPNKADRDKLKKQLMSICFSGTFLRREDRSIERHSGYMVADFDHVTDLEALRTTLTADKYTHVLFTSPSGDGLKVVFKVPAVIKEHKARFRALMEYFNREDFDPKNGNLSRVCYESYDPDIYYNPDSEVFTDIVEDQPYRLSVERPRVLLHSDDRKIAKLQKWSDRRFPITEGQRNDNLFKLASAFNRFGVAKLAAENHLKQYAQEGFDADEILRVITSAYRDTAAHNTQGFNDDETEDHIRNRYQGGACFDDIDEEIKPFIQDKAERAATIESVIGEVDSNSWWSKDKKGVVRVDNYKFKKFLELHGFRKFYPTPGGMFVFVQVSKNLVRNCSTTNIKDFVMHFIEGIGDRQLYNYIAGKPGMFKDEYLNMLDALALPFVRDTATYGTLFYLNAAVRVHKGGGIEMLDYIDLGGYVWADHIIQRTYVNDEVQDGEWNRFVELISSENMERVKAHRTTIGYLLHGYKDKTNNVAVIYNDGVLNENPNGGSGKGIIMQAISKLKRVSIIDGKTFSFDKGFPYQTVTADTQILLFDDVGKRFQFERLFSAITEGLEVEKKNKDAVRIPVELSPKVVITTNYTVQGKGGSHERRKWEVEMSPYFNATRRPKQVFGHNLFEDWNELQWQRFDNYMVRSLAMFLEHGLYECSWETQHIRKFVNETSPEFWEWIDEGGKEPKLKLGEIHYRTPLMEAFIKEYPDWDRFKYNLTGRRWAMWLDAYGQFKGWEVLSEKNINGHYTKYVTEGMPVEEEKEETVSDDLNPF